MEGQTIDSNNTLSSVCASESLKFYVLFMRVCGWKEATYILYLFDNKKARIFSMKNTGIMLYSL